MSDEKRRELGKKLALGKTSEEKRRDQLTSDDVAIFFTHGHRLRKGSPNTVAHSIIDMYFILYIMNVL